MNSQNDVVDQSVSLLPIATLFLLGVSKIFARRIFQDRLHLWVSVEASVAAFVHFGILPEPSIIPWWSIITKFSSRWVSIIIPVNSSGEATQIPSFRSAFLNGPLGPGASKVVQVIVAIGLWRFLKTEWPEIQWFGGSRIFPGLTEWIVLVGISISVNVVLYAWSRITNSSGTHEGVDQMVSSSKNRNHLTKRERILYGSLALANAICEEVSFRWFWRSEFAIYISDRHGNQDNCQLSEYFRFDSNFAQAVIFGMFHYYGIPSGLTGVCLTFVYGWIMGALMDHVGGGGLFLPIVAHTIADYYIFATIARGKAAKLK
eukprot:CAMPEP_0116115752 /NCGR_PEP_ID=MMETSP0329-20121206/674_1 /TAXON_ID=697910 /ORGANISM="Pseudo-nitzschia arenysensis, Strain B593" /LENGTH=316 /DNA_ID=CAMNT_0003609205 /DNA_START=53 /DNA_END=1003 /DNA_ORIENTATION=-